MHCFVHIGFHKTGSSSLQAFLYANAPALRARGMLYPVAAARGQQHGELAKAAAGLPHLSGGIDLLAAFDDELARTPHRVLIVSAEHLSTQIAGSGSAPLVDMIAARGYRPILVGYLRNQPQALNAKYVQNVKTARIAVDFADFVTLPRHAVLDHAQLFDAGRRGGREAVFRPFDAALRRIGVEHDFMALVLDRLDGAVGVDPLAGFAVDERVNVTREGPIFVETIRRAVSMLGADHVRLTRTSRARLARRAAAMVTRRIGAEAPYCGLDDVAARAVEERFRDGNDRFARAQWGRTWAEAFGDDVGARYSCNDLAATGDRRGLALAHGMALRLAEIARGLPDLGAAEPADTGAREPTEVPA